jgi:hypothetical protein
MQGPRDKYGSTLPVSKEKAKLVRIYCILNQKKVHAFVDELLEKELFDFKQKLERLKQLK